MNSDEEKKPQKKKQKSNPFLIIPNPIELYKNTFFKRPPSVPILSRKLSCDNSVPFCDENAMIVVQKPFKKTRRRSAVDLLSVKQEKTHRKTESKGKLLKKNIESKPPLCKKHGKLVNLEDKPPYRESINTSSQGKKKKKLNKIEISSPDLISLTEDKRTGIVTPNKLIKRLTDLRKQQNQELKRIEKELVHKTVENLRLNKQNKYRNSFVSENKSSLFLMKKLKKNKHGLRFEESPKRKEKPKKEHLKNRQKSPNDGSKKKPKKKAKKDLEKPSKKIEKIKKISKNFKDKIVENSYCSPGNLSVEKRGKKLGFQSDLLPPSGCDFLSPHLEKPQNKGSSSNNVINAPSRLIISPPRRSKIFKKPVILNDLLKESKAIKIQSIFRGWLSRKKTQKMKENRKNLNFDLKSDQEIYEIIDQLNKSFTFDQDFPEKIFEGNDKSDFQAPGPCEVAEQKLDEKGVDENKENLIEERKEDLKNLAVFKGDKAKIVKIEEVEVDEKEICSLFNDFLSKKYEQIYSMFDDNIKAVKEALAAVNVDESINIKEESIYVKEESINIKEEFIDIKQESIDIKQEPINIKEQPFQDKVENKLNQNNHENKLNKEKPLPVKEGNNLNQEQPFPVKPENIISKEKPFPVKDENILNKLDSHTVKQNYLSEKENLELENAENNTKNKPSSIPENTEPTNTDFEDRFYKKLDKCNKLNKLSLKPVWSNFRPVSPEIIKTTCEFPKGVTKTKAFQCDTPPTKSDLNSNLSLEKQSNLIWIDEVAMPKTTDFTGLVVDSVLEGLIEMIFNEALKSYFLVKPEFVFSLSEGILKAILNDEISKLKKDRKKFDEETIFNMIQIIFTKTQGLIIGEILKPLEKDPLLVLEQIQETEIGSGFFYGEKYAMLNLEAFSEDVYTSDQYLTIFNMLVFDCINDCLERLIVKEDLPWAIVKYKNVKVRTADKLVQFIVERIIKFNDIKSGQIGLRGKEIQISSRREKDALKMIVSEIEENEEDWKRFEKEETQSLLDTADLILETELELIIDILFNEVV